MTTPTQGEHAQTEALRLAACFDDNTSVVGAKRIAAEFRRLDAENKALHAQVAALTAQPAAPQGVAYADAHGAIMGAAYDFRDAHISGSPNQKRSAHAALESAVTHALRASNGQAPAGAAWAPQPHLWLRSARAQDVGTNFQVVDWEIETDDPVAEMDAIYEVYQKSMGKSAPDAEMAKIMEKTRLMLFSWWAWHRDTIRSALVGKLDALAVYEPQPATTAQAAPAADHDTLRCAVGNCTFNGEVERHANGCPSAPQAAPAAGAVAVSEEVAALVKSAQAFVLDPGSHKKKLELEALAWGTLAAAPTPAAQADSAPSPVSGYGLVDGAAICEAEAKKWEREAKRHKRAPGSLPSQHEARDLERARLCRNLAEKIRSTKLAHAADSVLEDAARLDWIQHNGATVEVIPGKPSYDWCFRVAGLHATTRNNIRESIDAARKQGGKHDNH